MNNIWWINNFFVSLFSSLSFIHMNSGLYRDEECIQMKELLKLKRILKNEI
jgi:hypothetical protein